MNKEVEDYKTVLADPPWNFRDKLDVTRRKPYREMTVEEIKNLPINEITDNEAHLYLWSTHSHIKEALEIMERWGFEYKTIIVWRKLTKRGKQWFGMGHYFRASRELCLFGIKGGLSTRANNIRDLFSAKKPDRHSGKPDEMYEIIEKASYPPYLELFAVKERGGWNSWGKEVEDDIKLGGIEE